MKCTCGTGAAISGWAETVRNWETELSRTETELKDKAVALKDAESLFQSIRDREIPKIESTVTRTAAQLSIETENILKDMDKATLAESQILASQETTLNQIEELTTQLKAVQAETAASRLVLAAETSRQAGILTAIEKTRFRISAENTKLEKISCKTEKLETKKIKEQEGLDSVIKDFKLLETVQSEIPPAVAVFEKQQESAESSLSQIQAEDAELTEKIAQLEHELDTLENSEEVNNISKREQVANELELTLTKGRLDIDSRVCDLAPAASRNPLETQQLSEEAQSRILRLQKLREKQVDEIEDLREFLRRHEEKTISAIKRLQANSAR